MAEQLPYSEKVMDHFMNPRNVGEIPDASGIGTVGNPICLSSDTLILSNPDAKVIKDITEGLKVLSHDGSYHNVISVHRRLYSGRILRLSVNNLGSCLVTPEHHILALRLGNRDKFRSHNNFRPDWFHAEELRKGDVILYPIPKLKSDTKFIDFDIGIPKLDFKSKTLPKKIKIDADFCRLVGYYLSEGYVRTDKCKGTIGFVFNSKEKEYIQDVIRLMEKFFRIKPANLIFNRKHTAADVPFYSVRLAKFFAKHFGKGASNKHLPIWIMKLPLNKQEGILCGMWRGDGYVDLKRQRAKYVTISKQLAFQLRLLFLRQKIIVNFCEGRAYGIHKKSFVFYVQEDNSLKKIIDIMGLPLRIKFKKLIRHKSWYDNNYYYTTLRESYPMKYKGYVYNLEVDGAHSFVSNAMILHNCGDVMKMFLKIENDVIVDVKFKTFGCGAAVATSSMVTEMVKGKPISEALKITNKAVAEALGGLPAIKMHCSVLAEEALRSALKDYYTKQGRPVPFNSPEHQHKDETCL